MYVTIEQPGGRDREKSRLDTWSKRVSLFAALLGIVISLFAFVPKLRDAFISPSAPLRGVVLDVEGQPVVDATVEVEQLPGRPQATASDGSFVFDKVPGSKGDRVRVFVRKPKYMDHNEYVGLPGPVRIKLSAAK
jgi:hypothetical protein